MGVVIAAVAAAFAGSVLDAVDTRDPIGFTIGVATVNPVDALRAD